MSGGGGSNITSSLTDLILVANAGNSSFVVTLDTAPSLFIDNEAKIGINTLTPTSQLEINSATGSCLTMRNNDSDNAFVNFEVSGIGDIFINPNANGSKLSTSKSFDIANHNSSTIGLKLKGTLVEATAAELNYLANINPGVATAGKAIVLDSNKTLSGLSSVSATQLVGTIQTSAQPNITSIGTLSTLTVSGAFTAPQLNGTLLTAAQPNITSLGTLNSLNVSGAITAPTISGTILTSHQPNITSIGPLGSISIAGTIITNETAYLSKVVPGTAAQSKVIVLDENSSIYGIKLLSAESLSGQLQTGAQPNITSIGTLPSLTVTNNVTASTISGTLQTSAQPYVTSLGALTSLSLAGVTIGSEIAYIAELLPGTASASKALVLDTTKAISGINSLSATALTGTLQTASQPLITEIGPLSTIQIAGFNISAEAGYLDGAIAGVATNGSVLVLGNNGAITGIGSLAANSLSGTLQTAAQPNITSVGLLSSLAVNGGVSISASTNATNTQTGALKVAGGLAVVKDVYIGGKLDAANITIGGSPISLGGGSLPSYLLDITPGTALNSKALVLSDSGTIDGILSLSANNLTGQLQTQAQPNITSLGALSSLQVDGPISVTASTEATTPTTGALRVNGGVGIAKKLFVAGGIVGTIQTSSQSGITMVGTLAGLTVAGLAAVTNTTDSTDPSTGALTINGGVGIGQKLFVGSGIYGVMQTAAQPNITSIGTLASLNVSGEVAATQLTGTLQTASQPNITSTGILTSLDVSGSLTLLSTTNSTSALSGALTVSGGVGIAKKLNVGAGIYGTVQTAAQPYITSLGTLSSLAVTGTVSADTLSGTLLTEAQPNITSVGTLTSLTVANGVTASTLAGTLQTANQPNITKVGPLTSVSIAGSVLAGEAAYLAGTTPGVAAASKAIVLDSNKNVSGINTLSSNQLSGTIQTGAQPNITSVGTLSSLTVTNGIYANQLTGALQTAAQPNITAVGTLSSLTVSGGLTASQMIGTLLTAAQPNITSIGTLGSLTVSGGIGCSGRIGVGTSSPGAPLHINDYTNWASAVDYAAFTSSGNTSYSGVVAAPNNVSIYCSGRIMCTGEINVVSDVRMKQNIRAIDLETADKFVHCIVPKQFEYLNEPGRINYGYIAQDFIRNEIDDLVNTCDNDDLEEYTDEYGLTSPAGVQLTLTSAYIIPLLHVKLRDLSNEVEELKMQISNLRQTISLNPNALA